MREQVVVGSGGVGQSKWGEIAVTVRDPGAVTSLLTFLQLFIFWIHNRLQLLPSSLLSSITTPFLRVTSCTVAAAALACVSRKNIKKLWELLIEKLACRGGVLLQLEGPTMPPLPPPHLGTEGSLPPEPEGRLPVSPVAF